MRWHVGLGLGAAALAVALFAWARDGEHAERAPRKDQAAERTPEASSPRSDDSAAPPRVMPRQRTMPRAEARPPVPPPAVEPPADPVDRPPPPVAPSAGAAPGEDPELTRRVETAKQLFEDTDFEATAAMAQEGLQAYPESFWLRSLAVKSLCALGSIDRAKELIAEEPRLAQRKRLRVHCRIQVDRWGNPG
jgi:hypothetical protein